MRCIRCNKALKAYAKQVTTDDGIAGWGPTCARLAFATKRRQPAVARRRVSAEQADPRQVDWLQQVAA